jgi:apolipoprotein N-acyltransferase
MGANLVALRFVPNVVARFTPLPWSAGLLALILLAAFEGVRWGIAGWVTSRLLRLRLPLSFAFPSGIYAGTFVPTVFPWTLAGGLTPWPELVQLADVLGERGVTALVALSAGLLAEGARALRDGASPRRASLSLAACAGILLAMFVFGVARMTQIETWRASAPTAKVALVQPSFDAQERWDGSKAAGLLHRLTELTKDAERKGADLTVWHESAYPYPLVRNATRAPIVQPGIRGPVMTGVLSTGPEGTSNSVVVATADGAISPPYDKVHLLWFGETVPFADKSRWLRDTFARGRGLVPGERSVLLRVPLRSREIRAGMLNCFEDTLPEAGREAALLSPNLLVNVTNDAWFAGSAESELHLRLSALRAVEARRDLVRSVNWGPTTWVDAAGRVRGRYAEPLAGVLMTEPALLEGTATFYTRWGDLPTAFALGLAGLARLRRRGGTRRPAPLE